MRLTEYGHRRCRIDMLCIGACVGSPDAYVSADIGAMRHKARIRRNSIGTVCRHKITLLIRRYAQTSESNRERDRCRSRVARKDGCRSVASASERSKPIAARGISRRHSFLAEKRTRFSVSPWSAIEFLTERESSEPAALPRSLAPAP